MIDRKSSWTVRRNGSGRARGCRGVRSWRWRSRCARPRSHSEDRALNETAAGLGRSCTTGAADRVTFPASRQPVLMRTHRFDDQRAGHGERRDAAPRSADRARPGACRSLRSAATCRPRRHGRGRCCPSSMPGAKRRTTSIAAIRGHPTYQLSWVRRADVGLCGTGHVWTRSSRRILNTSACYGRVRAINPFL